MHFISIKKKLLNNTLLLLVGAFCLILALVIGLNLYQSQQNLEQSQSKLYQHLEDKAEMLILSNQFALKGMVEDNSITNISDFIELTVSKDSAIMYGYFLDENGEFWVKSDDEKILVTLPKQHFKKIKMLQSITQSNHLLENGIEVIEFAAPIFLDKEVSGHIVYGYGTSQLKKNLNELKRGASSSALISIIIILAIVFGTLVVTYSITKKQADTITQPLASLAKSAKTIAIGNYDLSIKAETNDEIGELARDFESMRKTVKLYTKRLKDMVQEKISQINDILENIEEGICTISLDGVIQGQHSKSTLSILNIDNLEGVPLTNLLDLDDDQIDFFNDWLRLASTKYNKMRWTKIVQLCPLLKVTRTHKGTKQSLKLNFQKVYNKHDELEKLMVQILDVTEAEKLEIKVQKERIEHEHQLRLVLGIAENPPETIDLFIEDSYKKINEVLDSIQAIRVKELNWSGSIMNLWMENIHTIKGNAGSLGFEKLNQLSHQTENILLSPDIISGLDPINFTLVDHIKQIKELIDEIKQKDALLHGESNETVYRIPQSRYLKLIETLDSSHETNENLSTEIKTLHWKPLQQLVNKYQRIIEKSVLPNTQSIHFHIDPFHLELPPDFFNELDTPIIHLLRNAISHGFRRTNNNNHPIVKFQVEVSDQIKVIISDNGAGINPDKIYNRAIELGLIESDSNLNEVEKINLIFNPKFSSQDKATFLSGRGVGMSMVQRVLEDLDGSVDVKSNLNQGSTFTLLIPKEKFNL